VRIRCQGVGKNVAFSRDCKCSMQRFWEEGDDVDSDRVGNMGKKFAIGTKAVISLKIN